MAWIEQKAMVFNGAAPGVSTDILAGDVNPSQPVSTLRITACFQNTTVFQVMIDDGSTTLGMALNNGAPLGGDQVFTFTIGARSIFSYNFQILTDGAVRILQIDEVTGGVA